MYFDYYNYYSRELYNRFFIEATTTTTTTTTTTSTTSDTDRTQ